MTKRSLFSSIGQVLLRADLSILSRNIFSSRDQALTQTLKSQHKQTEKSKTKLHYKTQAYARLLLSFIRQSTVKGTHSDNHTVIIQGDKPN